jgi:hypothetical protein
VPSAVISVYRFLFFEYAIISIPELVFSVLIVLEGIRTRVLDELMVKLSVEEPFIFEVSEFTESSSFTSDSVSGKVPSKNDKSTSSIVAPVVVLSGRSLIAASNSFA